MPRLGKFAVFFDEFPFLGNPSGGIARATVGLAEALGRRAIPVKALGFRKSHFLGEKARSPAACNWSFLPWISRKSAWMRKLVRRGHFCLFRRLKKQGYRIVYHANGIGSDSWIARRADLHLVTIHDLIPERFDRGGRAQKTSAVFQRKNALRSAHAVTWVSEKTRQDFRRFYPRVRLAGRVIPHGRPEISPPRSPRAGRSHFLLVGHRGGYKNASLVYQALALFPGPQRPVLCLAGGESPGPQEVRLWDKLQLTPFIRWKSCSEKELAEWYSGAIGVVVPSKIEGFGLPALEAMAHGRVVICLKGSGVDELVRECGIILPSGTPLKLFQAMRSLLSASPRRDLEKKALRRASRFEWDYAAEQTADFYRRLLWP